MSRGAQDPYSPQAGKESNTQQLTLLLFTFPGGSVVKNSPPNKRHWFDPWVGKVPLEKEMATHSNVLTWRISWTEEPGGLQSTGLQRVGHD